MKIVTVLGARPQFIKVSVVSAEFAKHPEVTEVVVHTGQYFDVNMSDVFFTELGMANPAYHLDAHDVNLGEMIGRMFAGIKRVLMWLIELCGPLQVHSVEKNKVGHVISCHHKL